MEYIGQTYSSCRPKMYFFVAYFSHFANLFLWIINNAVAKKIGKCHKIYFDMLQFIYFNVYESTTPHLNALFIWEKVIFYSKYKSNGCHIKSMIIIYCLRIYLLICMIQRKMYLWVKYSVWTNEDAISKICCVM